MSPRTERSAPLHLPARRLRAARAVVAALVVVSGGAACGSLDDPSATDAFVGTARPPIGDEPPAHEVRTGFWRYDPDGIVDNGCGALAAADGDLSFYVPFSEGDRFVIAQGEPWGDFACFVAGSRFACPERLTDSWPVEGTDARVTLRVAVEGEVRSASQLVGEQRAELTCAGASCALAPVALAVSFPCRWRAPFRAERIER